MEAPHLAEELAVAVEHGHRAVEVVGVGHVLVVAEPGPAVLQVHVQHVGGPAELGLDPGLVVHDAHDVGLVAAERYRLQVPRVLLLAGEVQLVPVQELAGYAVAHHLVVIELRALQGQLLPVLGMEG